MDVVSTVIMECVLLSIQMVVHIVQRMGHGERIGLKSCWLRNDLESIGCRCSCRLFDKLCQLLFIIFLCKLKSLSTRVPLCCLNSKRCRLAIRNVLLSHCCLFCAIGTLYHASTVSSYTVVNVSPKYSTTVCMSAFYNSGVLSLTLPCIYVSYSITAPFSPLQLDATWHTLCYDCRLQTDPTSITLSSVTFL